MFYVGIDFHLRTTTMCILDLNGKLVKCFTRRGNWQLAIAQLNEELKGKQFAVCYEASTGYGWLHDQLAKIADQVLVAHPGHLRLIFRSKQKNDRADARKLAKLLFLDAVPTVHVPNQNTRSWRGLIERRRSIVKRRTATKCQIRALLRTHAITAPTGLWTKKGQVWLAAVTFPTALDVLQRDLLQDEIVARNQMLKRVEKVLDTLGADHPGVTLLRTIPGVGPRTAEAVVAYIDDPRRFRKSKAIGSYFGLVPSEDSSANKRRLGHVTRSGPASVRQFLTEAAWQAIRRSPTAKAFFKRVMRDDAERKKIAVVATAHYLLRVMLSMLRTGESWRETVSVCPSV